MCRGGHARPILPRRLGRLHWAVPWMGEIMGLGSTGNARGGYKSGNGDRSVIGLPGGGSLGFAGFGDPDGVPCLPSMACLARG